MGYLLGKWKRDGLICYVMLHKINGLKITQNKLVSFCYFFAVSQIHFSCAFVTQHLQVNFE
jgi:hypothetical protein